MIAEIAGVSKATVSRVINGKPCVSEETRRRVIDVIRRYNYVPNAFARALNFNCSYTIGLIITEITNIVTAEITSHIEMAAKEKGYSVMLCITRGKVAEEVAYVDLLRSRNVDGMIIIHAGATEGEEVEHLFRLKEEGMPFVLISEPIPGLETDYIVIDHERGAYNAVRHLLELGHRRIGYISGPPGLYTEAMRFRGYRRALIDYGIEPDDRLVREGGYKIEDGYRAALSLLGEERPTAIFCFNDMEAIGVLQAAKQLGLRIPDDLALVGTDDIQIAPILEVPLTTSSFPKDRVGRAAVDLLIEQIRAEEKSMPRPYKKVYIEHHLVIRDSCGAKRRAQTV